ncbi:hypothetical protein, partial [Rhodococcus globerulus]
MLTLAAVAIAAAGPDDMPVEPLGNVASWGWDGSALAAKTPRGSGFTAYAEGGSHSLALKSDGTITSWG